ncbi:MAG: exo-alpha-sialidase [Candidatus Hydrogenedentes bacterium]|nr:exo-alpha-sialidase [Candidatus Hydrogenedentota bacterium]
MQSSRFIPGLIALVLLITLAQAGALDIGATAGPVAFETLDAHPRTMNNYDERVGTVVTFLSSRCERTDKLIQDISALYEKYRYREILFVGVSSNPAESGDELRTYTQNNGLRFPIHRDPSGAVAKQFGATVTPEFFLLDDSGTLVYHGDLNGAAYEPGLEAAIQALLEKKSVGNPATPVAGTPIDQPGPAREIPDPYGTISFSSELIFTKIPDVAVHHCSTVAEAPNGDILCLWYAGSYESADDQALYLSRQTPGDRNWTAPERILWNPAQPPGNAVIFRGPDDRMWIVWGRMEGTRPVRRGAGWGQCRLMARTSDDNGHTWSEDMEVPDSFGWLPRNVPLTLDNGTLALPISGEAEDRYGSFLLYLQEDGKSWKPGGFIRGGGGQPTVIQRDNGDLLCLMRDQPRIPMSISTDRGFTWSDPVKTELKNPDSGIAMTKLASGRVLVVFNDTDQSDRTPLSLIQSYDDGETWKDIRVLEQDWGEFSYPSIIQASDGTVHVTYTYRRYSIKHVAFDEGWLTHLERPN